jgi:hypothetical protein
MTIREIRLLPPLAIARLGSAAEPLGNYTLAEDPERPLGYRRIVGAPTLIVDRASGAIAGTRTPERLVFKEAGHIRPVAPFLEVFALTEKGALEPLILPLLAREGLGPEAVEWRVEVQNRKVFRRTRDRDDIVKADTGWFGGHAPQPLAGRCENFVAGMSIAFGQVRYIRPNDGFPEIRLRFTPAHGLIYGPNSPERDHAVIPDARAVYDIGKGRWYGWDIDKAMTEGEKAVYDPLPPALFAIEPPAPPWLHDDRAVSRGYLDDACDGFVHVRLRVAGRALTACARISSGPPDCAPDSLFVRSLADDLEQIVHGPELADEDFAATQARAEDIVRRAYETVRFMNVAVMNGNTVKGRPPLSLDTMPAEEAFDTQRMLRPVMAPQNVDTLAVLALHQQVFAALRGGAAPWFTALLRMPEEAGDLTDRGRRKMPALMSGADGFYLTLTRRQIDTIRKAASGASFQDRSAPMPVAAIPTRRIEPRNLTAQLFYEAAGNPINSRPTKAVANSTPGLELDFRAVWRRLFEGIELSEHDNYVIDAEERYAALKGCRLLCVDGRPVVADVRGPSPADPDKDVAVAWEQNPNAVFCPEWSNNLAYAMRQQGEELECYFTSEPSLVPQPWREQDRTRYRKVALRVRRFFEAETAVIARALAEPGELTQGLCSPWQNDFRECSCYYWASARPDYVNVEPTPAGVSRGDNWFQKLRTGDYVPDDYADSRLIGYDDLFRGWERLLKFQIGGRDAPEEGDG